MFEAISQYYQSMLKLMMALFAQIFKTIKVIVNKIIFLIKLGFSLFFIFFKAIFYKENKINQNIEIG
jgi:hypothetical protein